MIFYFSGTGNSKWIAEQIAKAQNEVLVFMPNAIRDGIEEFVLADDEKVGFVFPVYSWGPPLSVLRFLDWVTLSNYHSQYVFFVCSCGDDTGLTEELFSRALSRKGMECNAGFSVAMPNNYVLLPGFDVDKKELEKKAEENKDLLSGIKEVLGDKVKDVKISSRLVDDPVCLSSEEGMSFEMEKVLSAMPEGNPYGMKASRILEINPNHEIFNALQKVYEQDKDAVKDYADLLYDQALLIEGFPIENPTEFSKKICDFMVKASK